MISKFDDIRPYDEKEFLAAMERIATSDVFPLLASFVYPTEPLEDVRQRVRAFKTVREFQHDAMVKVNEQVIARSMTAFTVSGLGGFRMTSATCLCRTTETSCSMPVCCNTGW